MGTVFNQPRVAQNEGVSDRAEEVESNLFKRFVEKVSVTGSVSCVTILISRPSKAVAEEQSPSLAGLQA